MASSWSQLPLDILGSILEILPLADHALLACVCVSWRSAVRSNTFRPAPQPPWLMLPPGPNRNPNSANFLSLSDNRVYNIPQPDPTIQTRVNIGSSMGWLITADERSELHLLNPITRSQINLPSVVTLPHVEAFRKWDIEHYLVGKRTPVTFTANDLRYRLYVKAIVAPFSQSSSSYSMTSHNYIVVLIYNPNGRLAFARAGDDSWTTLLEISHGFRDVIYHKGQFYTLDGDGNVEAWDLSGPSPKSTFRAPKIEENIFADIRFLVESSSGDLFQVHRYGDLFHDMRNKFKVFKMDLAEYEWVRVKGLDNEALFLGCSHSTSLSNFPDLRGNSIYFTGILSDILPDNSFSRVLCDPGIFILEDKRFEGFCWPDFSDKSSLPIWITPSRF